MRAGIPGELTEELAALTRSQQRVVLDFVQFLRIKSVVDPSQAYFWTPRWQRLERRADRAKTRGKRLGDGTISGLLKALHPRA